jgi:hypothetical protein
VRHNAGTRHLQKLLHHVIERLRGAAKRRGSAAEAVNALVLARVVMKYLAEGLAGPQLAAFVDAPVAPAASQPADQGTAPARACSAWHLLAGRTRPGPAELVAAVCDRGPPGSGSGRAPRPRCARSHMPASLQVAALSGPALRAPC